MPRLTSIAAVAVGAASSTRPILRDRRGRHNVVAPEDFSALTEALSPSDAPRQVSTRDDLGLLRQIGLAPAT